MKIKTTFLLLFSAIIFFILVIFYFLLLLLNNQQLQQENHINRYYNFRFGDELRQSSDHLTNYARSYVITRDSIWEKKFLEVARNRSNMFSEIDKQRHFTDSTYSLDFEKSEFTLLESALQQSNILAEKERKAMSLVKELSLDKDFNITNNSREHEIQLAINSLFDEEYLSSKKKIMEFILLYENLIDQRTHKAVSKYSRKGTLLLYLIVILITFVIAISVFAYLLISKRLKIKLKIANQLNERVKEQNCLYEISQLTETTKHSIEHFLKEVVDMIPRGWMFPEITCARITFKNKMFSSDNFRESNWKQEADIIHDNTIIGKLEVFCLEEKPEEDIGPFLNEEQTLLEAISSLIVVYYERKKRENDLIETNKKLMEEIAEKKSAEIQLGKSELQFKILVNSLPGIIYNCNFEAPYEMYFISDEVENLSGYPKENFLGLNPAMHFTELVHPDDIDAVNELVDIGVNTKQSYKLEYRIIHKNGQINYFYGQGQAIYKSDGSPDFLIGCIFNDTDRIVAVNKVKESEERFQLAVKGSNAGIWDLDVATKIAYWSDLHYILLGYEVNEIEPSLEFVRKSVYKEDLKLFQINVQNHIENGILLDFEARFYTKTKEIRWFRIMGASTRDEQGKSVRIVGSFTDITEKNELLKQLKNLQRHQESILQCAGEGIYGLDTLGRTTFANESAIKLVGYSLEEMIGKSQHDLIHHTKADGTKYEKKKCNIYASFKDGEVHRSEDEVFFRKDGTSFPVEYISTPLIDKDGNLSGAVVSFKDITEKKEAMNLLAAKEQQLQEALDVSNEGVWELKKGEVNIEFSDRCYTMLGYLPVENKSGSIDFWYSIIHKQDSFKSLVDNVSEIMINGLHDNIYRVKAKDGEYRWIHTKGKVVEFSDDGTPLRIVGTMSDISERMRQEEKVVSAILETEDKERSRIASDIHDGLQQTMITSLMSFEKVRYSTDFQDKEVSERFHLGYKFLKKAIKESRTLAHDLMPKVVDKNGIVVAIESLLSAIRSSSKTEFEFNQNLNEERIKLSIEITLYRITQETINNIVKYANAEKCHIQLLKYSDVLVLTIEDNGVGFDLAKTKNTFGINSMRTRAESIGAFFEINSRIGKGTQILVELPLKN